MTVAARPSVITYRENGVSAAFAVPFRFKSPAHLLVTRQGVADAATVLKLGGDYTVTGGATDAGGTVTVAVPVAGSLLRIRRRTPRAQPMVYTTGDRFPAKSHEGALDSAVLMIQETGDDVAAQALDIAALKLATRPTYLDFGTNLPATAPVLDFGMNPSLANTLDFGDIA